MKTKFIVSIGYGTTLLYANIEEAVTAYKVLLSGQFIDDNYINDKKIWNFKAGPTVTLTDLKTDVVYSSYEEAQKILEVTNDDESVAA